MINRQGIYQVAGEELFQFGEMLINAAKRALEEDINALNGEKYLSQKQVIEMLGVSEPTLWRWQKRGYITVIKIGNQNRYKLSEVKRIIEGK